MPVLLPEYKSVFVHVPKTGGQSIMTALRRQKDSAIGHHAPRWQIPAADRMLAFGFVRNPWDRMVSLYAFMTQKRMRLSDLFDQDHIRAMGFKKWLLEWDFEPELYKQHRHIRQFGWRKPQLWWLDGCDFVGRFENLQKDFDQICDMIGLKRREVPHINSSQRPGYREFYDCETAAAVTKWFLPDIEGFGYDF